MCTWLNRSVVPDCAFSIITQSGPRKYPNPPGVTAGSTFAPFARNSSTCSCVGKPPPGGVGTSPDRSTSLASASEPFHICAIVRPIFLKLALYSRELGVFQPKCHTEVCGPVNSLVGGVFTFVNRM